MIVIVKGSKVNDRYQIIRTLGVKHGYSQHVICRKIYEILYSKMFFKSLRKYMNQFYYDTEDCCNYKE